jgi:hypothetical protein
MKGFILPKLLAWIFIDKVLGMLVRMSACVVTKEYPCIFLSYFLPWTRGQKLRLIHRINPVKGFRGR